MTNSKVANNLKTKKKLLTYYLWIFLDGLFKMKDVQTTKAETCEMDVDRKGL